MSCSDRSDPAVFLSATLEAACTSPYRIELFAERIKERGFIGKQAILEVATTVAFCAETGTCQIGASEIGSFSIGDYALEVYARA